MRSRSWSRIATGVLIILIGGFLLLWTTGTIEAQLFWAWIPALFVLLGVWALVRSGVQNIVGPVMLIAIAGAFLLRSLNLIEAGIIGTYWPVFIILFGLLVIINRYRRRRRIEVQDIDVQGVTSIGIFGNDRRRITSDIFADAEAVSIFGDAEVDLRDCTIEDPPAHVEVTAIFGDVELRVPEEWRVDLRVMNLFGDVIDRRPRSTVEQSTESMLIVNGTAVFGDVELRD